jgi:hypothetical protein
MRKRLQYTREELPAVGTMPGTVLYRAKRKQEAVFITPVNGGYSGPYFVIFVKNKCKRTVTAATLNEAKETAEMLRASAPKRNPIGLRGTFLIGLGAGAVAAGLTMWWMSKNAAASTMSPGTAPVQGGTQTIQLEPGTNAAVYNGGTMSIALPSSATAWTSANNSPLTGSAPLTLQSPVVGSYTFGFTGTNGAQTATLTVTAGVGA